MTAAPLCSHEYSVTITQSCATLTTKTHSPCVKATLSIKLPRSLIFSAYTVKTLLSCIDTRPDFRSGNRVSMEPRPSIISVPDADLSPAPSRYYAADFHKLTNRRASSPSTPDYALPNRVVPARRTLPPADTADRRAFTRQDASPCVVQGAPANSRARQGSGSSIKEDAGGEITRNFVNIITRPHPSFTALFCDFKLTLSP